MTINWKRFLPTSVAIVLALLPAPAGLPAHAWFYFAIFAGVIAGLIIGVAIVLGLASALPMPRRERAHEGVVHDLEGEQRHRRVIGGRTRIRGFAVELHALLGLQGGEGHQG